MCLNAVYKVWITQLKQKTDFHLFLHNVGAQGLEPWTPSV
jgi:hypothetical protein